MIVIIGDSWGCGEWSDMSISHKGLEQYLRDYNLPVINLSIGGGTNYGSSRQLAQFLGSGILDYIPKITHVLAFQTEWCRDYYIYSDFHGKLIKNPTWSFPPSIKNVQDIIDIRSTTVSNWQYFLQDLAQKYTFKVGLIGGASDTIWLDRFSIEYPGVEIVCQSLTNLCVNNNHRVDRPVLNLNQAPIDQMKKTLQDSTNLELLIDDMDEAIHRSNQWKNNKEYFWPDGVHANRLGHKKLFELIMDSNFLTM